VDGTRSPQGGIFALGTASHAYLEFDALTDGVVRAVASLREPRTTMGGVNLVAGFRPELWREVVPAEAPETLTGFAARAAIAELGAVARLADETSSWPYRHDLEPTGFIDGTENPTLIDAPGLVLVPQGRPGAGGTILLVQKWVHDSAEWEALSVQSQEAIIGRTKPDSVELEPRPDDSHVASTDQDRFGKIFRRNMPYGTVSDHGTMFVGFSAARRPLAAMLESMAGLAGGTRDALTRYTRPVSGAYYFVPSIDALQQAGGSP
jgi:porphyrinogen peroxidase